MASISSVDSEKDTFEDVYGRQNLSEFVKKSKKNELNIK